MKNFSDLKTKTKEAKIKKYTASDEIVYVCEELSGLKKYECKFYIDMRIFDKGKNFQKEIKVSKWSEVEISFEELKKQYINYVLENGVYLR